MPKYRVERSIEIKSPPERVFKAVANFRTWTTWSPWLCSEPDADVSVTENSTSIGSVYSWKGKVVGQGEIEHRQLDAGRRIQQEIRFLKPFKSVSQVGFEFEKVGDGTRVRWFMDGSLPFFLFFLKSSMETFIGMDYERGLKMLKEWIETGQIQSTTSIRGIESVSSLRMAGVRGQCSMNDWSTAMKAAFCTSAEALVAGNVPMNDGAMTVYHTADLKARRFDFTSGFIIPDTATVPPELSSWSMPATNAFCVEHIGSYEHLGNAWSAAHQNARARKLKQSKIGAFEIYKNNPDDTPPGELCTEIYLPLK